ncbi:cobalamin B12-binding domain-containing protein [Candidatus Eisenbacteria bacterium]|uniref:Cobalamin B12-binding domain-containing protein n=1 Tax=Eiseniibacteriota bacterium TaxID=2212470 RepID=A0ABV6YI67_UNCEI
MTRTPIRVLVAKPGLDGHDVGAKVVTRALMNAGFEVIYTGLRRSATEIASIARDEDVDVVGLSILSGSHLPLCEKFAGLREEYQITDKLWMVGGNISRQDVAALLTLGVDGVFPVGSPLQSIVDFIHEKTRSA